MIRISLWITSNLRQCPGCSRSCISLLFEIKITRCGVEMHDSYSHDNYGENIHTSDRAVSILRKTIE